MLQVNGKSAVRILVLLITLTIIAWLIPDKVQVFGAESTPSEEAVKLEATTPPEEPVKLEATTVKGLITEKSISVKSKMRDTIQVTPAQGRNVQLQRYNTSKKKWETKKTIKTKNSRSASVVLEYPSSLWNKSKYTKWRVYLPETSTAKNYRSKTVRIITKNRSNVKLSCRSAIVINSSTGVVLYSKSMNTKRAQASLTKIMTATLALETNSLNKKVTISKKAAGTPYSDLIRGDKLTVRQLLYMALLESDNGAATALAETSAGSTSKFAKQMNRKSDLLGCTNTHYINPHGLDKKGHYSSAGDVALLTKYAVKNKIFRKIISTKKYTVKTLKKKKRYYLETTNQLLGKVKGIRGTKTGTTKNGGCCFASLYTYKNKSYITVVMGDKKDEQRWKDTKNLVKYIKKYGW